MELETSNRITDTIHVKRDRSGCFTTVQVVHNISHSSSMSNLQELSMIASYMYSQEDWKRIGYTHLVKVSADRISYEDHFKGFRMKVRKKIQELQMELQLLEKEKVKLEQRKKKIIALNTANNKLYFDLIENKKLDIENQKRVLKLNPKPGHVMYTLMFDF
ncbi:unnamed protein product [Meganyctiphanes norvegica]|uniref:Uncharacterized protein n=1 Tax=Meganyctiphanes norvegica TaxID=48144 RepID=A0AAV2SH08_MEGNR